MAHEIIITEALKKRFWDKIEKADGCWKWKASTNKDRGYGRIGVKAGICVNAHRVSWVIHNGSIPGDLFVCHKCDNPPCCNPEHLFLGTRQDNVDDMILKKRGKHFNTSEFFGVHWHSSNERWVSFIYWNGKLKILSRHKDKIEAARNHDRIAYIVYGERVKLNFPNEYTHPVE